MILTDDLMQPAGPITAEMFPTDDANQLDDRLQAYIDEGDAKLTTVTDAETKDAGTRAWALYRAYNAVADRLALQPSSANLQGLGSVGFNSGSIADMRRMAREQLALFDALVVVPLASVPQSAVHRTRVCW